MRIACPFCGKRELGEFTYLGDAAPKRPSGLCCRRALSCLAAQDAFYDYVYLRDNVAGEMNERWYHGGGCRSWLTVTRNTTTHEIKAVQAAPGAGARSDGSAIMRQHHQIRGDAWRRFPSPSKRRAGEVDQASSRLPAAQSHRLASRRPDRPRGAAQLHLRRQDHDRLRRRHACFGACRQRRQAGRPLVQVPSPARHPYGRLGRTQRAGRTALRRAARGQHPPTTIELYEGLAGATARTAGRRCATTSWR